MKSELLKAIKYIEMLSVNGANFSAKYNPANGCVSVFIDGERNTSFICPEAFDLVAKVTSMAAGNGAAWLFNKDGHIMEAN